MAVISKHRSFIMGIASLWIYYYHVFPIRLIEYFRVPTQAEIYFRNLGFCGVDIFLVLSGFGLYHALSRKFPENLHEYGEYALRRFGRIYPVFVPVTLFIALVDHWSLGELLGKVSGLTQLFDNVYVYLWYIPCIMLFYLLIPFYFRAYRRCKNTLVLTVASVVGVIFVSYLLYGYVREDLYAIINRIPVFLVGIYMGELCLRNHVLKWKDYMIAFVVLIVGVYISFHHSQYRVPEVYPCFGAALNLFIAPPLVVLLGSACEWLSSHIARHLKPICGGVYKVFALLGSVSLEFYVVQEWICLKTRNSSTLLALAGHNEWGQQAVCLVLTVIATALVHVFSEFLKGCCRRKK